MNPTTIITAVRSAQAYVAGIPPLSTSYALLEEAAQCAIDPGPDGDDLDMAFEPINAVMAELFNWGTQGWDSQAACADAAKTMAALAILAKLYRTWALDLAGLGDEDDHADS